MKKETEKPIMLIASSPLLIALFSLILGVAGKWIFFFKNADDFIGLTFALSFILIPAGMIPSFYSQMAKAITDKGKWTNYQKKFKRTTIAMIISSVFMGGISLYACVTGHFFHCVILLMLTWYLITLHCINAIFFFVIKLVKLEQEARDKELSD